MEVVAVALWIFVGVICVIPFVINYVDDHRHHKMPN